MDSSFRTKALAGLTALLLVFIMYSACLTQVPSERVDIVSAFIDEQESYLDHFNESVFTDYFYRAEFLENYSVSNISKYGILEIIPNDNPDIVITLFKDGNDIFFVATGYTNINAISTDKSYKTLELETRHELERVLEYIGHGELVRMIGIDDHDFATYPLMGRAIAFFGLLALITIYVFMMDYKKGWLLRNIRLIDQNENLIFGLLIMYFSTGMGLINIWALARGGIITSPNTICLVVCAPTFILSMYMVVKGGRKMGVQ